MYINVMLNDVEDKERKSQTLYLIKVEFKDDLKILLGIESAHINFYRN